VAALALALLAVIAGSGALLLYRAGGPAPGLRPARGLPHGTVALLRGTPYYWVADESGTLHWASDTRVLVGRYVRWRDVREVSPETLGALPRGEAWLPSPVAFVRAGDRLYLVRWDAGVRWPALLRVPSVEALRFFGITPEAVAARSIDRESWERLQGQSLESLAADLTPVAAGTSSAASGATPTPGAGTGLPQGWDPGSWSGQGAQRSPALTYPVSLTLTPPALDPDLGVVVGTVTYASFPCGGRLGLLAAGGDELLLAERLTSGLEHCTDQGRVTLTRRTEQRLFYTWTLPDDPLAVTAQLLRDDAPPGSPGAGSPGGGTPGVGSSSTSTVPAAGSTRR
jgi:hypothetical protein